MESVIANDDFLVLLHFLLLLPFFWLRQVSPLFFVGLRLNIDRNVFNQVWHESQEKIVKQMTLTNGQAMLSLIWKYSYDILGK